MSRNAPPPVTKSLTLQEASVVQRLPWWQRVDNLTLNTSEGALVQVLQLDGLTAERASDDPEGWPARLRQAVLGGPTTSRLAIYQHAVRRRTAAFSGAEPADPFAMALGRAWKSRLSRRRMFDTTVYLTLLLKPRRDMGGGLGRKTSGQGLRPAQDLQLLGDARKHLEKALAPFGARPLSLDVPGHRDQPELLAFLASLVHDDLTAQLTSSGAVAYALGERRLTFGLDSMEMSRGREKAPWFAALLSLKDYPGRPIPGLLDEVLRLPHELVVSECYAFIDRPMAAEKAGFSLQLLAGGGRRATPDISTLDAAGMNLGGGKAGAGEHHLTILVRAATLPDLDQVVADVQAAMTGAGAVGVREDLHLESGFWAQLPGGATFPARRTMVSASHFASFFSLNNCWRGSKSNSKSGSAWGEPVALLDTAACTPFAFNFHNGDNGHFCVIGPAGSGKTVLSSFLLAQSRKFDTRIVCFERHRGLELFLRAMGGRYHTFRPGESSGLNPLALPDSPATRAFLIEWLTHIVTAMGEPLSRDEQALLPIAVNYNFTRTDGRRRLSDMRDAFLRYRKPGCAELGARLDPWCEDGPHAWLFDNARDTLDLTNRIFGMDVTALIDQPMLHGPAMDYLFHRVEMTLDGKPAIILADQAWSMRHEQAFALRLKAFGQRLESGNAILGACFATSREGLDPPMSSTLVDQAASLILLPNPEARELDYVDGFGLSAHEFDLVRAMPGGPHAFLLKQSGRSTVARLELSGLDKFLTVMSPSPSALEQMDQLRTACGDAPGRWLPQLVSGQHPETTASPTNPA